VPPHAERLFNSSLSSCVCRWRPVQLSRTNREHDRQEQGPPRRDRRRRRSTGRE
jgi:hypothetical protein